jgi:hypothetical protein
MYVNGKMRTVEIIQDFFLKAQDKIAKRGHKSFSKVCKEKTGVLEINMGFRVG